MELNDKSPMPQGKFKGQPMENVPYWHLLWLDGKPFCNRDVQKYIDENRAFWSWRKSGINTAMRAKTVINDLIQEDEQDSRDIKTNGMNLFTDEIEQQAIDRIKKFKKIADAMGFEVCVGFSGGKDSQVVYDLCLRS